MIDLPSPKGRRQILATSIEKNNDVIQTEQFTTETNRSTEVKVSDFKNFDQEMTDSKV